MITIKSVREEQYLAEIPQEVLRKAVLNYLQTHNLPQDAFEGNNLNFEIFVRIPGGGDHSNTDLVLQDDNLLSIRWRKSEVEERIVRDNEENS